MVQQRLGIRPFHVNSLTVKLASVLGGALLGVAGIAFLCGEVVKYQAEAQLRRSLSDRAQLFESRLQQAEGVAASLRSSVLTLRRQNVTAPEAYQRLVLDLFKSRPEGVVGLGLGQSEKGLLPQRSWFSPYYQVNSAGRTAAGVRLPPPDDQIRYIDGTQPQSFYPDSDRYRRYFLPRQDVWSSPSVSADQPQISYYAQLIDSRQAWLGTVFVDIDRRFLSQAIEQPVLDNAGYFALLTESGQLIAAATAAKVNPTAGTTATVETYRAIPGLEPVWSQLQGAAGLVEAAQGYWVYERLPDSNWLVLAFVPYSAVFDRVVPITVGGTLAVGLVLTVAVGLLVRSINRRLQPLLAECQQLAAADPRALALMQRQDEIGQLSVGFSRLLEQLKQEEARLHQETARLWETHQQLQLAKETEQENQALHREVDQILQVVAAVEAGDLAVAAPVSPRVTGGLARSINRWVGRLGQLLGGVSGSSDRLLQAADQLEQLAGAVAEQAQQQQQTVAQIHPLLETVDRLSQETVLEASSLDRAVQLTEGAVQQGQQEATVLATGVDGLQQSTDQISKRTQTLNTYVELAVQFAKDQKRMTALTRILAVNASMLASRAAAQQDPDQFASITREFEAVATQVNDLAVQTNQNLLLLQQRTDRIQTVVSGLDHDVQEMSQRVNEFTSGVDRSQQVFEAMQAASQQVAQGGQRVTQASQALAEGVQTAVQLLHLVTAIAEKTGDQADSAQAQAHDVQQLAQRLLLTIASFAQPFAQSDDAEPAAPLPALAPLPLSIAPDLAEAVPSLPTQTAGQ